MPRNWDLKQIAMNSKTADLYLLCVSCLICTVLTTQYGVPYRTLCGNGNTVEMTHSQNVSLTFYVVKSNTSMEMYVTERGETAGCAVNLYTGDSRVAKNYSANDYLNSSSGIIELNCSRHFPLDSNITFQVTFSQSDFNFSIQMHAAECPRKFSNVKVTNISNSFANFSASGTFKCQNETWKLVNIDKKHEVQNFTSECGECRKWKNQTFECWKEPSVELSTNVSSISVRSGDVILFICNIIDGYPEPEVSLILDNKILQIPDNTATIEVNHTLNGKEAYCNFSNNLTRMFSQYNTTSNVVTLVVWYPPVVIEDHSCSSRSNDTHFTVFFNISFMSNPEIRREQVYISFANASNVTGQLHGSKIQYYEAIEKHVRQEDLGRFELITYSTDISTNLLPYSLNATKSCELKDIDVDSTMKTDIEVTSNPTSHGFTSTGIITGTGTMIDSTSETTTNDPVIIAAAAGGGGLLLIATIIVTCCIMKKRKKTDELSDATTIQNQAFSESSMTKDEKEDKVNPIYDTSGELKNDRMVDEDKKEVVNPLYGTTPVPTNDLYASVEKKKNKKVAKKQKPGKSEKEEKLNPLYEGASTSGLQVEEAYAEVDRRHLKNKKDKKKGGAAAKGEVNGGFSQEPTAESMYAVVDKKKTGKGKKSDNEPSTSAGATQDCTYAEVQKKHKKKKDDNDDEDLHGSSKD